MAIDDVPQQTDRTARIDRRTALKKGAFAATVAGVTWSAPTIKGLSLRPVYASAQSGGLVCVPAGGDLVIAFGNDGHFTQFLFQIQNETTSPLNWEAVWTDRPYASIPDPASLPADITYNVTAVPGSNPAVYDHRFTSSVPLAANSNVQISAGTFGGPDPGEAQRPNDGASALVPFRCT